MQHTVSKINASEAEVAVTLGAEDLEKYAAVTYEKVKGNVKAAGFRPGMAPRFIVESELGERWKTEVLETAITLSFFEAVREGELVTIAPPEINLGKYVPKQELEYKAKVVTMPEVTLPDYTKFKVEKKAVEVTSAELDEALQSFRRRAAKLEPKESAAERGDRVEVDFATSVEGKAIERGEAKNHPFVIGEGMFIPGFEDQIIGMKGGEEKNFELKFPDDFGDKMLAGKPANFKVKLHLVHKVDLPALDDAFAATLGGESLDALKNSLKDTLVKEKEYEEANREEGELLEQLAAGTKVELPEILINDEVEHMVGNLESDLGNRGLKLDQYLASMKKSFEELKSEMREQAMIRLKISLAMTEIAKREGATASDAEVEEQIKAMLESVEIDREAAEAELRHEDSIRNIKNRIISEKTLSKLKGYAGL